MVEMFLLKYADLVSAKMIWAQGYIYGLDPKQ